MSFCFRISLFFRDLWEKPLFHGIKVSEFFGCINNSTNSGTDDKKPNNKKDLGLSLVLALICIALFVGLLLIIMIVFTAMQRVIN